MEPHPESHPASMSSHASVLLKTEAVVLNDYQAINQFLASIMLPISVQPYNLKLDHELASKLSSDVPLSERESSSIIRQLTPKREQLLRMLQTAGFSPSFHRGGYLKTINTTYSAAYPRINQRITPATQDQYLDSMVKPHRNISPCGASVDEFIYMLSGTVYFFFLGEAQTIHVDLTASGVEGWLIMFKGGIPHGGTFSANATQLGVVIGPKEWLVETQGSMP